ncbi:SRPBCC family protein [Algihabitans albus]|uniref:SRPBCC family protein n=1 Tax=Algihabitans albus TaxID=2164067 RepID=UPI000E5C6BC5|nr:carbon monoxide dehydrogenase subunit G [Algihabitans albus]
MQMTGEYRIEAPREAVWAALNDPEVLKASIPGCEELQQTAPDAFEAKVRAKVGPVSARFAGAVSLSDIVPPESYTISGEGKGGAAGFASGGAKVRLEEIADGATQLHYEVDAKVGGKLAQLGSRLIDSTAKKMADQFFTTFAQQVTAAQPPAAAATTPPTEPPATEPTSSEQAALQQAAPGGTAMGQATPPEAAAVSDTEVKRRAAEASTQAVKDARATKSLSPIVWVAGLIAVVAILWVLLGS